MPDYQHIFTDGLDKILSTSTWLSHYGGKDTFVYYTKNKLKGYVSHLDEENLAEAGFKYLQNHENVQILLEKSNEITQHVNNLQKQITDNLIDEQAFELFNITAELLEKGYQFYFSTEEFNTSKLDTDTHKELIEKLGKYRLEFIETNILSTEILYGLAARIGEKYGISEKDIQFLTHEEVSNLATHPITPEEIEERKQHFLIKKHEDRKLTFLYGKDALVAYEALVSKKALVGNTLTGMGASVGKITGSVYILSLTDENIHDSIENMPNGAILVTESTQPSLILACNKASAIVTDEGGVLSHAAIVSRELGIPCVVGTRNATELLKNDQTIEVDGEKGIVTILKNSF